MRLRLYLDVFWRIWYQEILLFLQPKESIFIPYKYLHNKTTIACVTIWEQHNYHFPLPQNSILLQKKKWHHNDVITKLILIKFLYNQSDIISNISKFHQIPTHSNPDKSRKCGWDRQTQTDKVWRSHSLSDLDDNV